MRELLTFPLVHDLHGAPSTSSGQAPNPHDYPDLWPTEGRIDRVLANGFGIGMIQSDREAMWAAEFLNTQFGFGHGNIVELGSCCGGWMYVMHMLCGPGARISLDMPWDKREPKPKWPPDLLHRAVPELQTIEGNIHSAGSREKLVASLDERKVDLLFIDADHSYEGTRQHWQMYANLVRPGGWVGFHDTANGWPCGNFFREICKGRTWREFVEGVPEATVFGIGFVQV
jgi:hypothetical protein